MVYTDPVPCPSCLGSRRKFSDVAKCTGGYCLWTLSLKWGSNIWYFTELRETLKLQRGELSPSPKVIIKMPHMLRSEPTQINEVLKCSKNSLITRRFGVSFSCLLGSVSTLIQVSFPLFIRKLFKIPFRLLFLSLPASLQSCMRLRRWAWWERVGRMPLPNSTHRHVSRDLLSSVLPGGSFCFLLTVLLKDVEWLHLVIKHDLTPC